MQHIDYYVGVAVQNYPLLVLFATESANRFPTHGLPVTEFIFTVFRYR
jgi:hypothetical protein